MKTTFTSALIVSLACAGGNHAHHQSGIDWSAYYAGGSSQSHYPSTSHGSSSGIYEGYPYQSYELNDNAYYPPGYDSINSPYYPANRSYYQPYGGGYSSSGYGSEHDWDYTNPVDFSGVYWDTYSDEDYWYKTNTLYDPSVWKHSQKVDLDFNPEARIYDYVYDDHYDYTTDPAVSYSGYGYNNYYDNSGYSGYGRYSSNSYSNRRPRWGSEYTYTPYYNPNEYRRNLNTRSTNSSRRAVDPIAASAGRIPLNPQSYYPDTTPADPVEPTPVERVFAETITPDNRPEQNVLFDSPIGMISIQDLIEAQRMIQEREAAKERSQDQAIANAIAAAEAAAQAEAELEARAEAARAQAEAEIENVALGRRMLGGSQFSASPSTKRTVSATRLNDLARTNQAYSYRPTW